MTDLGALQLAIFGLACVVVPAICHWRIRRYVVASLLAAAISTTLNVVLESARTAVEHPDTFGFGMDDLVFWGPLLIAFSAVPALVLSFAVGAPFLAYRSSATARGT